MSMSSGPESSSIRRFAFLALPLLLFNPSAVQADPMAIQHPKVLVLNFDPLIPSEGNRPLHEVMGWNDPTAMAQEYISNVAAASHGLVLYRIVAWQDLDIFPVKTDGFRYTNGDRNTPGSYLYHWYHGGWHQPDAVDYNAFLREYDVAWLVETGQVDEVWAFGAPYFGYWESAMAGKSAFWINGGPIARITCSRKFPVMGFSYERGIGEMLEDLGHRSESTLTLAFGGWQWGDSGHDWERFTLAEIVAPDNAACGNVHFAPNSVRDYDWANPRYVWSTARDWLENYPNLTGERDWVNCTEWGGGNSRAHKVWWFSHMPHVAGRREARLCNWWAYLIDYNGYVETRGTPGSLYDEGVDPGVGSTFYIHRVSQNPGECAEPTIDDTGRVLWCGGDGSDREIYGASADGTSPTMLSSNLFDDARPRQSSSGGRVVWQASVESQHDIFAADADGSGLLRLTTNATPDLSPQINAAGRVVWFGFDGNDMEIYAGNADGSGFLQLTDNLVDDEFPRINDLGRVVWMSKVDADWEICTIDDDGTAFLRVTTNTADDERPVINASGMLAWHARESGNNWEIYTADADAGSPVRITSNTAEDWWPVLSADDKVAWMGYTTDGFEIFEADAFGGPVTQVTDDRRDDVTPSYGPNGALVWSRWDGADHEIVARRDGTLLAVTDNSYDDWAPRMSGSGDVVWTGEVGSLHQSAVFSTKLVSAVDVGVSLDIAELQLTLSNPLTVGSEIRFGVPTAGLAEIDVYEPNGRLVRHLVDERVQAGMHVAHWDGRSEAGVHVSSGVYYFRLRTDQGQATAKGVLLR